MLIPLCSNAFCWASVTAEDEITKLPCDEMFKVLQAEDLVGVFEG